MSCTGRSPLPAHSSLLYRASERLFPAVPAFTANRDADGGIMVGGHDK